MSPPNDQPQGQGNGIESIVSLMPTLMMMMMQQGGKDGKGPNQLMMVVLLVVPILLKLLTPKLNIAFQQGLKWRRRATRVIVCTKEVGGWKWWDDKDDEEQVRPFPLKPTRKCHLPPTFHPLSTLPYTLPELT